MCHNFSSLAALLHMTVTALRNKAVRDATKKIGILKLLQSYKRSRRMIPTRPRQKDSKIPKLTYKVLASRKQEEAETVQPS